MYLSLNNSQVSRSFAAVIRQLPKMLVTDIVVFYLVLRGLDTVEDDMTAFDDIQVCREYESGGGGQPQMVVVVQVWVWARATAIRVDDADMFFDFITLFADCPFVR